MRIWRLQKKRYVSPVFTCQGSLKTHGRWHRRGTQVAYASEHPAVAALEKLAGLGSREMARQSNLMLLPIDIRPDRHLEVLSEDDLPEDWDAFPHPRSTQEIGVKWVEEQRSVVLSVPSASMHASQNFLINPFHPHFQELEQGEPMAFNWDTRFLSTEAK